MDLNTALSFARVRRQGVLTTLRKDGRPQLSNIMFLADGDDFIISVTSGRAKTNNVRRDPRAALYVAGDDFWSYVVLDGTVTLTDVATSLDDDVADALVDYYQRAVGEHEDWAAYRQAMVDDGRLIVRLTPTSAAGMVQG